MVLLNLLSLMRASGVDTPVMLIALTQAAQVKARLAMPKKKKKGEDAVDENPVFEVSTEEKLFKGDPNDRKALLRHKQHVKARPLPIVPDLQCLGGLPNSI